MKDEELFKAWKSEQYKDQSTEEKLEFVEHLHNFPKYFETTFLAGLKAGRPQWHDLRKDPKDLPKDENYVLVSNGKDWTKAFYKDKKWNIICLVGFTKIIAWKEIVLPELKESE